MRVEELNYNEAFWIALDIVIKPLKGWHYEISGNYNGWINFKKNNVAYFTCCADKDIIIEVREKKYFNEVVEVVKQIEIEMTKQNLVNFKKEIIVKKRWDVENLLKGGE